MEQQEKMIIIGAKMSLKKLTNAELAALYNGVRAGWSCKQIQGYSKVEELFDRDGFCRNSLIIKAFELSVNERI